MVCRFLNELHTIFFNGLKGGINAFFKSQSVNIYIIIGFNKKGTR